MIEPALDVLLSPTLWLSVGLGMACGLLFHIWRGQEAVALACWRISSPAWWASPWGRWSARCCASIGC